MTNDNSPKSGSLLPDASRIEEFYQALVEAVDDVIFVVGGDGRYAMFNERGLKSFGYSPAQVIGKTPSEAFGAVAGERFEANNRRVLAEGRPVVMEEWLTIAKQTRCFSTVLSPILDGEGKVRAVVGIGRDVTDMKRMAEELEVYAREMESIVERRVHFERLLTGLTQDAIKRQPLADFLASVVARLGDTMGVSRAYIYEYDVHRKLVSLSHEWTGPGVAATKGSMQDVEVGSQPWVSSELLAGRVIRLENAERVENPEFRGLIEKHEIKSLVIVPIFAFGNPFGFIGFDECMLHRHWEEMEVELLKSVGRIIAQTAERRRLESEMLRTERLSATGRLAASVAHEINNPLQAIMLHLDAIRDHVDKKRRRNLDFVVEGLQRIARIISRLLGLHRSDRKLELVDVNGVVEDVMGLVSNQLAIKGAEVHLGLAEGLPRVMGDAEQLHHVFLNVILNASDSMESGGILAIKSSADAAAVCVEVSDTGAGMDEESLPYMFEPFFSTKGRSGTGLGLFVSHSIVSDHGGRMEVESRKGKGTSIKVFLPLAGPGSASLPVRI